MMRKLLQSSMLLLWLWARVGVAAEASTTRSLDDFENVTAWSAHPADGVEVRISQDTGAKGRSMRLDFRFVKGGGYAVVRRALEVDLPEHYRFRFRIRGEAPVNNLEFKLADASGENVWWSNQRDFHFPRTWQPVTLQQRHITFAWGPLGGGALHHAASLEFAITAGSGGQGTVWIDELELETLPPPDAALPEIVATASSVTGAGAAEAALDGDATTAWQSAAPDTGARLTLDLGTDREFDGLTLQWRAQQRARDYDLEGSADGREWLMLRRVRGGTGELDRLHLPDHEARWLRVHVRRGPASGVALAELRVEPIGWAPTRADLLRRIAQESRRGLYPRGVLGEMAFWTVVGADDDREEGLLGEDGALETRKASFTVEPFIHLGDSLLTWADVAREQTLARGDLPLPSVRWIHPRVALTVSVCPEGAAGRSSLVARYRVRNPGMSTLQGTLYLALRPFQVNPPVQFLNTPGGAAPIRRIEFRGGEVIVNRERIVRVLVPPGAFGAVNSDGGDIVADFLATGHLPSATRVSDTEARASAALAYPFKLAPGAEREIS
ncbi:MAG: discoidin domain-containing protein, partial [Candidatus Eisenbacteria bacterium]